MILNHVSLCYALAPVSHKAINEHVARNALDGFSLDAYLKDNLEIKGGIEENFDSNEVWEWVRDGGRYEDIPVWYLPYLRSANHFHNPLTEQGYSGFWGTGIVSGMSSTQWMLLPRKTQRPKGYYSWYDVRYYYLKALTSPDKDTRNTNFAETFRGVGQLMHLVQDASVPAHTRDDGHPFYNYETWVRDNLDINDYGPIFFGGHISTVASLIDTNQYIGSNPEVTLSSTVGVSEYANVNFASEETIFTENYHPSRRYYFPYPRKSSVELYEEGTSMDTDGGQINKIYLRKVKHGETIEHFAIADRLFKPLENYPHVQRKHVSLDDKCYEDYAQKLIPRAVGYSAGLLNHFLRGQIDMTIDPEDSSRYVIKNLSGEEMKNADFTLYYDDADGNRYPVTGADWHFPSIKAGKAESLGDFELPTDLYPEPAEKGKYILVFHGKLGSETGAVAGKVVTLESEDFWEDWEDGFTGKHPWEIFYGSFEVVDGFGDNTSKVLKMYVPATSRSAFLRTDMPDGFTSPKRVSFDYYVESMGTHEYTSFSIGLYDLSDILYKGKYRKQYLRSLNVVNELRPCGMYSSHYRCYRLPERGGWVRVEYDLTESFDWMPTLFTDIDFVSISAYHYQSYGVPIIVYIDNIKFEY